MVTEARMTATDHATAWQIAQEIFPEDVRLVEASLDGAGEVLFAACAPVPPALAATLQPPQTRAEGVILSTSDGAGFGLDVDFIPAGPVMTLPCALDACALDACAPALPGAGPDAGLLTVWINGRPVPLTAAPMAEAAETAAPGLSGSAQGLTLTMGLRLAVQPGQVNTLRIALAAGGRAGRAGADAPAGPLRLALGSMDPSTDLPTGLPGDLPCDLPTDPALADHPSTDLPAPLHADPCADLALPAAPAAPEESPDEAGPCLVAGSLLPTVQGLVPVEALSPGDLILTQDAGPQPLSRVLWQQIHARGDLAPVRIASGSFGASRDLHLWPGQPLLIQDSRSASLFEGAAVHLAACDLVDGHAVQRIEGDRVDYIQILFDRPQAVLVAGLEMASLAPVLPCDPLSASAMAAEVVALFAAPQGPDAPDTIAAADSAAAADTPEAEAARRHRRAARRARLRQRGADRRVA
jgi:hypothetical protein